MPGLLDTCEELFQTKDLYQVFGIEKSANASQIKKAYHKVIIHLLNIYLKHDYTILLANNI